MGWFDVLIFCCLVGSDGWGTNWQYVVMHALNAVLAPKHFLSLLILILCIYIYIYICFGIVVLGGETSFAALEKGHQQQQRKLDDLRAMHQQLHQMHVSINWFIQHFIFIFYIL